MQVQVQTWPTTSPLPIPSPEQCRPIPRIRAQLFLLPQRMSVPLLELPPSTPAPLASSPIPNDSNSGPEVFHDSRAISNSDDDQPDSTAHSDSDNAELNILRPKSLRATWKLARAALAYYQAN